MPTLSDLLSDPDATIEVIVKGSYLDADDILHTAYFSRSGWSDPPSGTYGAYIPPLVDITLRLSRRIDPLNPATLIDDTFSDIRLINNSIYPEYIGIFDSWSDYSVAGQPWTIYIVGVLSTGIRVELSDVISTPLYSLVGIDIPEVSSNECIIRTHSRTQSLDTVLQPNTYSPPCPRFPGLAAQYIDLGDNLDITGVQSLSFWINPIDPISTTQYLAFKDSSTTGYYLAIGLVGAGTVPAGVEVCVRGQSPALSTTAANVIRAGQDYRIDISIDTTTRRIDIDGTTALTTSSITGTPTGNSLNLLIGKSFKGRISRAVWWSDARSNAVMSAEGRLPISGNESNLREAFPLDEGGSATVSSVKSGSTLTGTLTDSVVWDNATWHYQSIRGQYEPYVLGTVPRVPVTWIDPPKQIGQVSHGSIALFSELQSNHGAISSSNYTVDYDNSTFKVTSGALSGTYSATITANNLWNTALLLNGTTSKATATVAQPAGSKYMACHLRLDTADKSARQLIGWNGSGHIFLLYLNTGAINNLDLTVVNDAGSLFNITYPLSQDRRYSVFCSLDTSTPSTGLELFVDGLSVGTKAISGTFTSTPATFSVGHRSTLNDLFLTGVLDEIIIGNTAGSLALAKAHHTLPSTSAFSGIIAGWHCDRSLSPFAGAVSLSGTDITYTAGRSAAIDLARVVLYAEGFTESDIDADSFFTCLRDNPADCGWFAGAGQKSVDILNVILGGLGMILSMPFDLFVVRRFEGLTGNPDVTFNPLIDSISEEIIAQSPDPAIYRWIIEYATNNVKLDPANINGSLASTDPDRWAYGSVDSLTAIKSDYRVLDRFPSALSKVRRTALINQYDAEMEAERLLSLHKEGADNKSVAMFVGIGQLDILDEIGPLQAETNLNTGTFVVVGIDIEEGMGRIVIWRPTRTGYISSGYVDSGFVE